MLASRTPNLPKMTPEEFFAWHERQEEKYELIDGYPVLKFKRDPVTGMAGGTAAHGLIMLNAGAALRAQLRGKRCRPLPSDVAVKIPSGKHRYPDLSIDCGPLDRQAQACAEPVLVLEVLSPTTTWKEQNAKLADYQSVPTLRYIVLVEQARRYAQIWTRRSSGWTLSEHAAPDSRLAFPSLEVELAFDDLYEGVEPEEEGAPPA